MRRRMMAVLVIAVLMTAAGCAGAPSRGGEGRPVEGGALHLSLFSSPKGVFNPLLAGNAADNEIGKLVFSGLLTLDDSLMWTCDLCESYAVSPDNLTVTFVLRSDVHWHDGRPLTAADVAFTFRSMLHPEHASQQAAGLSALAGVEKMLDERDRLNQLAAAGRLSASQQAARLAVGWKGWLNGPGRRAIEVVDQRTIKFTTDVPYGPLLGRLAAPILPAHIFGTVPLSQWAAHPAVRQPVGTGPYRLVAYRPDESVELAGHEGYHRGRPYIPQLIYHIENQRRALGQFMAGKRDYVPVTPGDLEFLQRVKQQVRVAERPGGAYDYMGLRHDSPLFADRRVRQALMHALNRQKMIDVLLKGHGRVMNTHMLPSLWGLDGAAVNAYPYDPARAAELLAEAGWTELDGDGWRMRKGRRFAFTLKYPSGSQVRKTTAAMIRDDLKKLGLRVDLEALDFGALVTEVFGHREADAWLLGWELGAEPDPGPAFLQDNKWGRATGWRSSRSDELIRQGRRLLQTAERQPVYAEWARLVNEELPFLFLYARNEMDAVRADRVRGLKPDARGATWNIWEWWIPKAKQG